MSGFATICLIVVLLVLVALVVLLGAVLVAVFAASGDAHLEVDVDDEE